MDHGEGHSAGGHEAISAAGSPAPALDARELSKRFGSTAAVEEISLTLRAGEVRGLLGPNGAGKTTLLRMLLGLLRADSGSVEIFGTRARWRERPLSPLVAGFVEAPAFYPYLSGRANLEVLAELDGAGARGGVDAALDQVGLAAAAGRRVAGYSTGMRQRLGIASALLRRPRLLLLDEPTSGLDPAGARFVGGLVRELAQDGVAVLLSSHQINEVEGVCDAFTVLRSGRAVWAGSSREMREQAPPPVRHVRTSDDTRAASLAAETDGVRCEPLAAGGLAIHAGERELDTLVLALGRGGIAVRSLEQPVGPLEAMFFALTEGRDPAGTPAGS